MKVLYIGHYRDGNSGWAQAAKGYIMALHRAGVDVVPRALKLNTSEPDLPDTILDLENQSTRGCNVVIQHILPHHMEYSSDFDLNVGLYATETSSFRTSNWPLHLNCMDMAVVINQDMVQVARDSGVDIKLCVVPHAFDTDKFMRSYTPLDIPEIAGDFTFYTIMDLTRRKNLVGLLTAFHLEFRRSEPVSLLIKTGKYGTSIEQCQKEVFNICETVKRNLKLYTSPTCYKPDVVVCQHLSEEDLCRLHKTCNCYVSLSYGEAFNLSVVDALGFGNTPICTRVGGMKDILERGGGYLVDTHPEPVAGVLDTFNDIYTARETWWQADIDSARAQMRRIYELYRIGAAEYTQMREDGIENAMGFSYESVGRFFRKVLEDEMG